MDICGHDAAVPFGPPLPSAVDAASQYRLMPWFFTPRGLSNASRFSGADESPVIALDFSPDGSLLASATYAGLIEVYSFENAYEDFCARITHVANALSKLVIGDARTHMDFVVQRELLCSPPSSSSSATAAASAPAASALPFCPPSEVLAQLDLSALNCGRVVSLLREFGVRDGRLVAAAVENAVVRHLLFLADTHAAPGLAIAATPLATAVHRAAAAEDGCIGDDNSRGLSRTDFNVGTSVSSVSGSAASANNAGLRRSSVTLRELAAGAIETVLKEHSIRFGTSFRTRHATAKGKCSVEDNGWDGSEHAEATLNSAVFPSHNPNSSISAASASAIGAETGASQALKPLVSGPAATNAAASPVTNAGTAASAGATAAIAFSIGSKVTAMRFLPAPAAVVATGMSPRYSNTTSGTSGKADSNIDKNISATLGSNLSACTGGFGADKGGLLAVVGFSSKAAYIYDISFLSNPIANINSMLTLTPGHHSGQGSVAASGAAVLAGRTSVVGAGSRETLRLVQGFAVASGRAHVASSYALSVGQLQRQRHGFRLEKLQQRRRRLLLSTAVTVAHDAHEDDNIEDDDTQLFSHNKRRCLVTTTSPGLNSAQSDSRVVLARIRESTQQISQNASSDAAPSPVAAVAAIDADVVTTGALLRFVASRGAVLAPTVDDCALSSSHSESLRGSADLTGDCEHSRWDSLMSIVDNASADTANTNSVTSTHQQCLNIATGKAVANTSSQLLAPSQSAYTTACDYKNVIDATVQNASFATSHSNNSVHVKDDDSNDSDDDDDIFGSVGDRADGTVTVRFPSAAPTTATAPTMSLRPYTTLLLPSSLYNTTTRFTALAATPHAPAVVVAGTEGGHTLVWDVRMPAYKETVSTAHRLLLGGNNNNNSGGGGANSAGVSSGRSSPVFTSRYSNSNSNSAMNSTAGIRANSAAGTNYTGGVGARGGFVRSSSAINDDDDDDEYSLFSDNNMNTRTNSHTHTHHTASADSNFSTNNNAAHVSVQSDALTAAAPPSWRLNLPLNGVTAVASSCHNVLRSSTTSSVTSVGSGIYYRIAPSVDSWTQYALKEAASAAEKAASAAAAAAATANVTASGDSGLSSPVSTSNATSSASAAASASTRTAATAFASAAASSLMSVWGVSPQSLHSSLSTCTTTVDKRIVSVVFPDADVEPSSASSRHDMHCGSEVDIFSSSYNKAFAAHTSLSHSHSNAV